jgi:hypothetical protein
MGLKEVGIEDVNWTLLLRLGPVAVRWDGLAKTERNVFTG